MCGGQCSHGCSVLGRPRRWVTTQYVCAVSADRPKMPPLDLAFVRSQFPAFEQPVNAHQSFFENAGGSFACRQTIDALTDFYTRTKVQPYSEFESSSDA